MRNILLVFLLSWAISDTFGQVQFLGSPTTTVRNRGNFVSDSLFYLPKRQKAPSDTGAIRYAIADSSVYVWSGFQWAKVGAGSLTSITAGTGLTGGTITTSGTIAADTLTLSTRAWRQKGIDSVNANVALKVNISDTSNMLSPYIRAAGFGLTKSGQSLLVDSATMATRARVQKGIDSVAGLARVTGSGTTNYVPKFTGSTALGNSQIFDNGTNVGVGTASPISFAKATIQSGVDDAFILLRSTDPTTATSAANIRSPINTGFSATPIYSFYFQSGTGIANPTNNVVAINTQGSERARITSDGELLVNTSSDAGAYALQVAGSIYNTTGAVLAASSGNVGIGTTSPAVKLEIAGSGTQQIRILSASGADMRMNADNVGRTGTYSISDYIILTNGSERVRITSGGDVGIGTGSPNTKTEIFGGDARVALSAVTTSTFRGFQMATGTTEFASLKAEASLGELRLTSGFAGFGGFTTMYTNGSERLRIFANGRVGVNTTTDAGYQLDVNGSARAGSVILQANSPFITGSNISSASSLAVGSSSGFLSLHTGNDIMQFNTNGSERMRITASGNVGIGTTSPSERLHVSGKARITTIDSSSSPINLLWSNVDGVIQKTSVASVIGSGTAKYIPKFATATTLTNSLIYEDNNEVRINTTSDAGDWVLQVSGNSLVSNGQLRVSANANTGISLARSGTSEVFMETGNTSGGLKVGVAGSTGGSSQGFSGYAGYILTNAAYPLQFGSLDTMRMTLNTAGELLISTSTTDNGNYKLQVDGNVWSTGSLTTGDPTSGTKKPWKLGSKVAASVQLDTANYVEVEIDGVLVRLAIVTPL